MSSSREDSSDTEHLSPPGGCSVDSDPPGSSSSEGPPDSPYDPRLQPSSSSAPKSHLVIKIPNKLKISPQTSQPSSSCKELVNAPFKGEPPYPSSVLKIFDADIIRREFHIPLDYEIIIPKPDEFMFDPPDGCRTFFMSTLESGLRFPIPEPMENILRHLGSCPAQLMPNSYCLMACFIVIMQLFGLEPSWAHFWTLFQINESNVVTGDGLPFYYLAVKKTNRFIDNVRSSNGKNWKTRFFFVKHPPSRPWQVPRTWKTFKPKPKVEGRVVWPSSFILDDLTICSFDDSVINNERILSMAGISPAPYPPGQSLAMSLQDAMIENKMHERKEYLLSVARARGYPLFVGGVRNPLSKSASSKSASSRSEARPAETAHSEPVAPPTDLPPSAAPTSDPTRLSPSGKGKRLASQGSKATQVKKAKHSTRSFSSSAPKSQAPSAPSGAPATDTRGLKRKQPSSSGNMLKKREKLGPLSDEEFKAGQKFLQTMTKYSDEAREEFLDGLDDEEEPTIVGGEPLQLSCALTTESFVIDSKPGHTSFDLYKSAVLDRDLISLAGTSVSAQEELAAYHGHSFMSYLRSISLHCTYWKHRAAVHSERAKKNSEKADSFDAMMKSRDEERAKLVTSVDGLKTELALQKKKKLENLRQQMMLNKGELDEAQAALKEKDVQYTTLLAEKEMEVERVFSRGRAVGVEEIVSSSDFREQQEKMKSEAIQQHLSSPAYLEELLDKAAEHAFFGFLKCQNQVLARKGFRRGFDLSELDACGEVETLEEDPYSTHDPEPSTAPHSVPDLHHASSTPPAS
ncbi:hypothetical protein BUALT_Bualt04G0140900 [Buddleja alternifolia]|uniref:Transposase (putative) gypsy type domain-containing protein n=1 Tax=Buddleja alternifolia TaxID=168488 RepID=A0AAV6XQZ6_9LAMI|nr:hypothetical protein BUALT_Bualt04G0140900 [Buddleja alternifolia]